MFPNVGKLLGVVAAEQDVVETQFLVRAFHTPIKDHARGGSLLPQYLFRCLQIGKQASVSRVQVGIADHPVCLVHLAVFVFNACHAPTVVENATGRRVGQKGDAKGFG